LIYESGLGSDCYIEERGLVSFQRKEEIVGICFFFLERNRTPP